MSDKLLNVGPLALTTTLTTNVYQGGSASALLQDSIHQIRISNKTAAAAKWTLYKGATGANAAGTEIGVGQSVPANDYVDVHFADGLKMLSTDFIVGGSDTATALTIIITGRQSPV
jgi:hypothetical protein